jgi:hypothetical protein
VIEVEHDDEDDFFSLAELIQDRMAPVVDDASTRADLERLTRLAIAETDGPDDDDEGPPGGVREPRRPLPGSDGTSGQQLRAEFGFDEAAP